MKNSLLALLQTAAICSLSAQGISPPINSGNLLSEGARLLSEKNYAAAAEAFKTVDENDTNYVSAMLELVNIYVLDGKDSLAVRLSDDMLREKNQYELSFYLIKGNCLNNLGKFEQGLSVFNEALTKYPNNYLIYYNLGTAYAAQKNTAAADKNFLLAASHNPYHSSSHLKLGLSAFNQGRLAPAILSLLYFLQIENATSRSAEVVAFLEKVVKGEVEPSGTLVLPGETDDFSDLESIIRSKIALNGKYKSKINLQFDLVKQLQLFLEKLQYNANDKGFWMQTYVPYFTSLQREGFFEDYMYYILSSVHVEPIDTWLKKHESQQEKFVTWAFEKLGTTLFTFEDDLNGEVRKVRHYYYSNRKLEALGVEKNGHAVGYWKFYYRNGHPKSEGSFNNNGKKDGLWKSYFESGVLHEELNYTNGELNGAYTSYYPNGAKELIGVYRLGLLDGPVETFTNTNGKAAAYLFKQGKKVDHETTYYPNGAKKYEVALVNSLAEGPYKHYHMNGQLSETGSYVAGDRAGTFVTYYPNGTKMSEGSYQKNLPVGAYKLYHTNGQLKEEGQYNDKGKFIGLSKLYNMNGSLREEYAYSERGKLTLHKYYSPKGKLENELIFKNDELAGAVSYNEKGEVISDQKKRGDNFTVTFYQLNGNKFSEGSYVDGLRDGEWKFYDADGYLFSVENYKNGIQEGKYVSYHPNGKVKTEYNNINDQIDGLYRTYRINGTIEREGYYSSGSQQGYWNYYYEDGTLSDIQYFLNGELSGKQTSFSSTGKKSKEDYYKDGYLSRLLYFDSLGNITSANELPYGSGSFTSYHYNSKQPRLQGTYKYGEAEGLFTWYYRNGNIETQYSYVNGNKEGEAKNFHDNGTKSRDERFQDNELNGEWISYYRNGSVHEHNNYVSNKLDGEQKSYYENKILNRRSHYSDGKAEGSFPYYAEDGQLIIRRYYENDLLLAYSYTAKGKYDSIPVKNETGRIVAYYPNGQKSLEYDLQFGHMNGARLEYYANGKLHKEHNYYFGLQDGLQKEFFSGGGLKKEFSYLLDQYHGAYREFHENGKIKVAGKYINGNKYGDWKYYDTAGTLTHTDKYYDDQLIK